VISSHRLLCPANQSLKIESGVPLVAQPPLGTCEICVIVPARDESARIERCLSALATQVDLRGIPINPNRFEVIVLANNCRDDTAALALAFGRRHPELLLYVVDILFSPEKSFVGCARKLLMDGRKCLSQLNPASCATNGPRVNAGGPARTRLEGVSTQAGGALARNLRSLVITGNPSTAAMGPAGRTNRLTPNYRMRMGAILAQNGFGRGHYGITHSRVRTSNPSLIVFLYRCVAGAGWERFSLRQGSGCRKLSQYVDAISRFFRMVNVTE
jgi:glycosyltransferase involved in cell wall biosynthesis